MNGNELQKKLKKLAKIKGLTFAYTTHGKGGHGRFEFGDNFCTCIDRREEIGPKLLNLMLGQLGLTKKDLGL